MREPDQYYNYSKDKEQTQLWIKNIEINVINEDKMTSESGVEWQIEALVARTECPCLQTRISLPCCQ